MSRAARQRAERESKKREKRDRSKQGATMRELRKGKKRPASELTLHTTLTAIPWDERSPKCPHCGADWIDMHERWQCFECGLFRMKEELEIAKCERCERKFVWDELICWEDDSDEEHELCSDCVVPVMLRGDISWLRQ